MPLDPPTVSVTSGSDRLSQREQIEQILTRARTKGEVVRVRLPLQLYDHDVARSYTGLRDATWNLSFPVDQTTPETVEALIQTLGACLVAIGKHGSERVARAVKEIEG